MGFVDWRYEQVVEYVAGYVGGGQGKQVEHVVGWVGRGKTQTHGDSMKRHAESEGDGDG